MNDLRNSISRILPLEQYIGRDNYARLETNVFLPIGGAVLRKTWTKSY